jgi:manganese transport protein
MRRLITRLLAITPAFFVILFYGEEKVDALLVFSQVILSLQLGFAIIPLIHFVSNKVTMGKFVIGNVTKVAAWLIAAVLIYLNCKMLLNEVSGIFTDGVLYQQILVSIAGLIFMLLLGYIIFQPVIYKPKVSSSIEIHKLKPEAPQLKIPQFKKIAVALDFTNSDDKLISYAMGQGNKLTQYLLIHIVESASANLLGNQSDDFETRKDQEKLDFYIDHLKSKGFSVEGNLGYKKRAKEIVRLVKENNVDMLVVGAHGHTGLKDFIYGETINTVRHELKIPVLVVHF